MSLAAKPAAQPNSVSALAQTLHRRIDDVFGAAFAGDLAEFFERICASLSALIIDAHFAQVQDVMKRFLFDPGFQEVGVRICEDASKVIVRHDTRDTNAVFPQLAKVGDMDGALARARARR
jgi:nitrate reductase NapAB chaperone NapD